MARIEWNRDKNAQIYQERDVSFEDVLVSLALGGYGDIIAHPNPQRYPNQFVLLVDIDQYAYAVPFLVDGATIFFKTLFPSRKWTKHYLGEVPDDTPKIP